MVHFSKLKLYGFKSFVDKTELDIGPGLNGVVGPNGCGKSNLVEALRWVMGEKSAKNMRGGGMEDVIFAGTSKRPPRNMAQATIVIDNQDGNAPAPFNTASEIEISRHIEREKGSQYRVNGKAVRARDVNLLFADTMTGANSPALVSQGRITEIIVAKPQDRRRILEESAGISGLHSRRHEAELRLKAADQNLVRLNDAMNDIRSRLTSLKRQSRQAERYKELNNEIRKADMAIAWTQWRDVHQKIRNERDVFAKENEIVQSTLQKLKDLEALTAKSETTLPELRKKDMESRAVLQNLQIAMDRLDEDAKAKERELKTAKAQQTQLHQDLDFAKEKYNNALGIIENSNKQLNDLKQAQETLPARIESHEQIEISCKQSLDALSTQKTDLETQIAVAVEGYDALLKQGADLDQRIQTISFKIDSTQQSLNDLIADHAAVENEINAIGGIDSLDDQIDDLGRHQATLDERFEQQLNDASQAQSEHDESIQTFNVIDAEYNALNDLIARQGYANNDDDIDLLLNHLNIQPGFEKAVSNALGHWVTMAGTNDSAHVYWQSVSCNISTPDGYTALAEHLDAPKNLSTFFASIGVCETLPKTLPQLAIGQTLVAKDGGLMRWDGLVVKPSAVNEQTDSASLLFEQKNRLAELAVLKTTKEKDIESLKQSMSTADQALALTKDELASVSAKMSELENEHTNTRHTIDRLTDRITSLSHQTEQKKSDLKTLKAEHQDLLTMKTAIDNQLSNSNQSAIEQMKTELDNVRHAFAQKQSEMDTNKTHLIQLRYENDDIERQTKSLTALMETTQHDSNTYNTQIESIVGRLDTIDQEIQLCEMTQNQDDVDSQRESILSNISNQQQAVDDITIALEKAESEYKSAQGQLRATESTAAAAREKRALAQANVANAEQDMTRIQAHIQDKFELSPQSLEEQTLSLFENGLPDNNDLHAQREDNLRRRDAIGPVNLRAAIESRETESQLAMMETEHNDLTKAIAQLRGGISKLNREARERLAIAFKRVDAHFQTLFNQLFTGGKAYLEMIESDDPLESGLEIYAQPPGKALQKLSLLSGGEQTLTATALIFAMFMTNPSPICVLDEIDAPLDDANVDRVCSLMEKIVQDTDTRFIVITHHRMTMARMDRLYGVTMSERGVSQLVSVDMAMQDELALNETA